MFFFTYRFVVCLLIYPLLFFSTQGTATSVSHLFPNIGNTHCIDDSPLGCEEMALSNQNAEELNQVYRDNILGYFSDILLENSSCICQENDACKRGCSLTNGNKGQHLPIRKCEEWKPLNESRKNCASHVNGAIMTLT